jgi:hypothetical protein
MTHSDPPRLTSTDPGNPVAHSDTKWRAGDLELLIALAKGSTRRDAARSAGVSERTAHRRLAEPGFRTQLDTLRQRLLTARIQHEATAPPDNTAAENISPASSTDPESPEPADVSPPSTPDRSQSPDPPEAITDTGSRRDPPAPPVVTVPAHRLVAEARHTNMRLTLRGADTLLWQPESNRWLAAPTRDVSAVYQTERTNTPPERRPAGTDKPAMTVAPSTRSTPPQTQPTPPCTCGTQRHRPSARRRCPVHGSA